jgi:hypothetical protein
MNRLRAFITLRNRLFLSNFLAESLDFTDALLSELLNFARRDGAVKLILSQSSLQSAPVLKAVPMGYFSTSAAAYAGASGKRCGSSPAQLHGVRDSQKMRALG